MNLLDATGRALRVAREYTFTPAPGPQNLRATGIHLTRGSLAS